MYNHPSDYQLSQKQNDVQVKLILQEARSKGGGGNVRNSYMNGISGMVELRSIVEKLEDT